MPGHGPHHYFYHFHVAHYFSLNPDCFLARPACPFTSTQEQAQGAPEGSHLGPRVLPGQASAPHTEPGGVAMGSGKEVALHSAPESAVVSGNLLFASGIEETCSAWMLARPGTLSVSISFWPLWPESLEKLRWAERNCQCPKPKSKVARLHLQE